MCLCMRANRQGARAGHVVVPMVLAFKDWIVKVLHRIVIHSLFVSSLFVAVIIFLFLFFIFFSVLFVLLIVIIVLE